MLYVDNRQPTDFEVCQVSSALTKQVHVHAESSCEGACAAGSTQTQDALEKADAEALVSSAKRR